MAPQVGFEPTTDRLTVDCSTTELLRNTGRLSPRGGRLAELRAEPKTKKGKKRLRAVACVGLMSASGGGIALAVRIRPQLGRLLGRLARAARRYFFNTPVFCCESLEATAGIEPAYTDLQSAASPLRHVAFCTISMPDCVVVGAPGSPLWPKTGVKRRSYWRKWVRCRAGAADLSHRLWCAQSPGQYLPAWEFFACLPLL